MLAHRERRLFTPEEYLAIEEKADTKSEYYRGEIFSMSGGSIEHGQISANLTYALVGALRGTRCQLLGADVRLHISQHELFTYPDMYVVCGPLRRMPGRKDTLLDATLVVEILSETTELYDRGEKFFFYKSLPSFKEYLLISQKTSMVERHAFSGRKEWISSIYGTGEKLALHSITCELDIDDIYRGVEFLVTE